MRGLHAILKILILMTSLTLLNSVRAETHFADQLPTLQETQEMVKLSSLVYKFRYLFNYTCNDINMNSDDDLECHWYQHDIDLGTQVMLVSNNPKRYVALVFAGTDDLRTSLEDANIFTKPFGNNQDIQFNDTSIHVHAGFDNAIFSHNIWEQVYRKTMQVWEQKTKHDDDDDDNHQFQLYTTGHSLGAANAILTATAFGLLKHNHHETRKTRKVVLPSVKCINFGAPQTGNYQWKEYFNASSPLRDSVSIFRVVLAWDLVARLPEFFYHVGHTIQIDGKSNDVKVYYEHYGEASRGYAGAPMGWYSQSYAWLPFALNYHHIHKYREHLMMLNESIWVKQFFPTDGIVYDDDIWDNPPDDWIQSEELEDVILDANNDGSNMYRRLKKWLF